jgi:type II secretory pathway pseudopilin PulG
MSSVDRLNPNEDSRSERGLSNFAKMLIVLALVVATVFAFLVHRAIERANGAANTAVTKVLLMNCRLACLSFYTNANRWPVALLELTANTNGIVYLMTGKGGLLDSWGRPLIYVAPAGTNVPGCIQSLGADGLPGGTNLAADISVTIP